MSPTCASPRSTAISAKPRTSRPQSRSLPARTSRRRPRWLCASRRAAILLRSVAACARERDGLSWPPMTGTSDRRFMSLALTLGRRGLGNAWPNPAVGSVVVKDGIVAGRGWTQPGGRPHAEVEALRRAGAAARGATLYATLEPCSHHGKTPPCVDAIVAAGIARVVSALEDPNPEIAGQGHARLKAHGIAVTVGVCADGARHAHAGHIR